jgi:Holliday junction resolvase RusA-like endonuclease
MVILTCTIPGNPVAKGRPRSSVVNGRVHVRSPQKSASWETHASWVMSNARQGICHEGPVAVFIEAVKQRPSSGGYPSRKMDPDGECYRCRKPDVDNVAKAVLDALEKSGIIANDLQVCDLHVLNLWAGRGCAGEVRVSVSLPSVDEPGEE